MSLWNFNLEQQMLEINDQILIEHIFYENYNIAYSILDFHFESCRIEVSLIIIFYAY